MATGSRWSALAAENELVVDAECAYSRSGEGLHRFADPADGNVYMYSDLETFDAHRVYACFDQPDMKAQLRVHRARAARAGRWCPTWRPTSRAAARRPAAGRWHFPPTPLMSTYITHVSAGPWHVVRYEHDGIPLGIFCRQSLARYLDPDEIFEVTRQGFDFFHARVRRSSTRSASTTSSSCPSSRKARWRTRARSPSSRTTSSGRGSPTSPGRRAARRSCTRWRTCGSATW